MATGLMDTTCPPSTQFAAFNKMTCEKKSVIYPTLGMKGCRIFGYDLCVYAGNDNNIDKKGAAIAASFYDNPMVIVYNYTVIGLSNFSWAVYFQSCADRYRRGLAWG